MSDLETPKTFPLTRPLESGGKTVEEVVLREPDGGECESLITDAAKGSGYSAMNLLIAKQAKLAPVDVRKIGSRDLKKMHGYLQSFLDESPEASGSEN